MFRKAVLFSLCLPCLVGASQSSQPPSSANDGVVSHHAGINGGKAYWSNPYTLGSYAVSGDGYQEPLSPGRADSHLGLVWKTTLPDALTQELQRFDSTGGMIRTIFIGESAGWLNSFGYTRSGNPTGAGSFTVWNKMQSIGCSPNVRYGDFFDLTFAAGEMAHFDFWFGATGGSGKTPAASTKYGGIYTAFHPEAGSVDTAQYLWATSALPVKSWIPSLSSSAAADTYLVSVEDWRIDRGADGDYSDFRFALQFLNPDGTPMATIPEPATWSLSAGALAMGWVLLRRLRVNPSHRLKS